MRNPENQISGLVNNFLYNTKLFYKYAMRFFYIYIVYNSSECKYNWVMTEIS